MPAFDAVYVRGSYKYGLLQRSISEALWGKSYLPLAPTAFTYAHDKSLTMIKLLSGKVPVPKSYIAATAEAARSILEKIPYPIIVKIPQGTQGKGVMFADSLSSARTIIDTLEVFNQPYLIQEYVDTKATDVRAIVIGDKVVAAMKRKAKGDEPRANIHLGATGTPYDVPAEVEEVAVRAAKCIGAEICGVDILESDKPYVIEINTSASLIGGISEATQKNVAGIATKFIADKTKEFMNARHMKDVSGMLSGQHHELVSNISVKGGVMKLPPIAASLGEFRDNDEVLISVRKGKVVVKKEKT